MTGGEGGCHPQDTQKTVQAEQTLGPLSPLDRARHQREYLIRRLANLQSVINILEANPGLNAQMQEIQELQNY